MRRDFLIVSGLAALVALLPVPAPAAARAAPFKGSGGPVLLVVGDSLSAEYGLARGTGWVQLLADRVEINRDTGQALVLSLVLVVISFVVLAGLRDRWLGGEPAEVR